MDVRCVVWDLCPANMNLILHTPHLISFKRSNSTVT
jgi:hypothetical protein